MIVGAGPTGLTAATLLAQYGVECLVLDRWESIYPQPRAVALDDEVHRILARLGLRDAFAAISRPHRGLRLLDRNMRVLAEFPRGTAPGRHGYPQGSMFDQPELEAILRRNLQRFGTVTLRGNAEVTALTQDSGGVRVDVTDTATGEPGSVRAAYVLGCDGANSLTRASIGATMRDLGFTQRWLVIDVATEADLGQWEGVHQLSDPARAGTYMRIGRTRYRWEFQLSPGETADDYRDMARLHPLISRWTGDIPVAELKIIRVAEYTFRAQVADRWRDRRVFLLGDAAHLTPPFIGQGLCAGLRDAMNLAWKLAGVLRGTLAETALDTYQIERGQHARAMIKLARLIGTAMTAGGEWGNVIRRAVAPRLHLVPGLTDLATDSRTPPLRRSDLVVRPRLRRGLAGGLCPNAIIDGDRRFDDVAAGRFAIVTSTELSTALRADIERHGAVLIVASPGSALHRWLRTGAARAAVVRPDGTVLHAGRRLLPQMIDAVRPAGGDQWLGGSAVVVKGRGPHFGD
ncbi:bifunctional 3-(3-hydroxy-phenyl)propionate/3-hydroxycinnamic acid hydroxylase [Micromonospora sp. MA102]|uniref:bifunctional 3-(3-hydroxy-phenyl)propionate/3-hydroxycinnamic acid hydroxylase MhpA n=1 Tax=Micromonospora sp. MA102 TaxID=2952755 RepID=UPI0021C91F15|nr:bifunctional 3-(3-hydroxy-phenyl)propionate/3-hydroxycinnamic acid hydroxylase [Micromonospora sp. MA102]